MPMVPHLEVLVSAAAELFSRGLQPKDTLAMPALMKRQNGGSYTDIMRQYQGDGKTPPGTVVGIVLGTVCGFLLVVWLIAVATTGVLTGGEAQEEVIIKEHRRRGSRRSREFEFETRGPVRDIIIEENRPRGHPPPMRPQPLPIGPPRHLDSDDEIVEVIQEGGYNGRQRSRSPSPKRKGRRNSSPSEFSEVSDYYRSETRRKR